MRVSSASTGYTQIPNRGLRQRAEKDLDDRGTPDPDGVVR